MSADPPEIDTIAVEQMTAVDERGNLLKQSNFHFLKIYDIDVAYTVIFNQVRLVVLIIIGVTLRKFLVFVSK